jgi:hypothetical protein
MSDHNKIAGRVRGLNTSAATENREDEHLNLTPCGDGYLNQGLPELAELVRLGDSWQVLSAAWTALTGVPTTVAIQRLWNGEPGNGKIYVIDSVCVFRPIIDVTTDDSFCVFAQTVRAPIVTAVPTDDATVIRGLSTKPYGGRARKDSGTANSAVSGRWDFIGQSPYTATAIAGTAWACVDIPLFGRYVIPPGVAFDIHASEVTATASGLRSCIRWHEVQLPYVS